MFTYTRLCVCVCAHAYTYIHTYITLHHITIQYIHPHTISYQHANVCTCALKYMHT